MAYLRGQPEEGNMDEETLRRILNDSRHIDNETHNKHHQWITSEIKQRNISNKRWEKFRLSIIGTVASGLVAALAWVGKLVIEALHKGS